MGQISTGQAPFIRHIDKAFKDRSSFPELERSARLLKDVMEHPGFRVLRELIELETDRIEGKISGPALTGEEYARLLGRRGGLTAFVQAGEAVIERSTQRAGQLATNDDGAGESVPER